MIRRIRTTFRRVMVPVIAGMMILGLTGCSDQQNENATETVKEADNVTENVEEEVKSETSQEVTEAAGTEESTESKKTEAGSEEKAEKSGAGSEKETDKSGEADEEATESISMTSSDGKTHITDEAGGAYSQVVFSGDPDELVKFDKHTYFEGDDFYIFFQKDTEIPGDTALFVDQIMAELEEVEHMKYSDGEDDGDSYWRDYYFDGQFQGINEDCDKINIFVLNDPENGNIECATVNECILYDDDFTNTGDSGSEGTVYHELAHVLRLRQSPYLGDVMEEGVALYSEYELMKKHGYKDYSMIIYVDDYANDKLLEKGILEKPERAYWDISYDDDNIEQLDYQYGFRFVCFLYEEYGDDVIKNIGEVASKTKYDDYETDPSILIEIIKKGTSEDVFERFGQWLPENWAEKSAECRKYLGVDGGDWVQ